MGIAKNITILAAASIIGGCAGPVLDASRNVPILLPDVPRGLEESCTAEVINGAGLLSFEMIGKNCIVAALADTPTNLTFPIGTKYAVICYFNGRELQCLALDQIDSNGIFSTDLNDESPIFLTAYSTEAVEQEVLNSLIRSYAETAFNQILGPRLNINSDLN